MKGGSIIFSVVQKSILGLKLALKTTFTTKSKNI